MPLLEFIWDIISFRLEILRITSLTLCYLYTIDINMYVSLPTNQLATLLLWLLLLLPFPSYLHIIIHTKNVLTFTHIRAKMYWRFSNGFSLNSSNHNNNMNANMCVRDFVWWCISKLVATNMALHLKILDDFIIITV